MTPEDEAPEAMPRPAVLARVGLALGIGTIGGAVFSWLGIPLPWMLGAMVFTTVAAVLHTPVLPPTRSRPYVMVVLGVMLGAGFTPDFLDQAQVWALSAAFLALCLAVTGVLVVPFYRRVGGFDTPTAYFSGMPGGLAEMMLIGKEAGGDDRKIVLAHASRILVTVSLIALWFRFVAGLELGDRSEFGVSLLAIPLDELGILTVCGVAGYFLGQLLRLPAGPLMGPMVVSAVAHVVGLSASPAPSELIVVAQIFLGTIMGCRFIGGEPRSIGRALLLSLGATFITLSVTLAFALLFHGLFQRTVEEVLLAFAPGGVAEMSLVALAMGTDVAYVALHHMLRIILVILLAPLGFALLTKLVAPGSQSGRR